MKTLKQLDEQKKRFNGLWKYASADTRKKAREVWIRKYAEVRGLCDCGQYCSTAPGANFADYARHYAAKVHGGRPEDYSIRIDMYSEKLDEAASDIYNNLAIF